MTTMMKMSELYELHDPQSDNYISFRRCLLDDSFMVHFKNSRNHMTHQFQDSNIDDARIRYKFYTRKGWALLT